MLASVRAYRGDAPEAYFWQPGGVADRLLRLVAALDWRDGFAFSDAHGAALAILWRALPAHREGPRLLWIEAAPDAIHLFAASDLRRLLHSERTDANNAALLAVHDTAIRFAARGGEDAPLAHALAWFAASIRERDDNATAAAIAAVIAARDAMPPAALVAHRKAPVRGEGMANDR